MKTAKIIRSVARTWTGRRVSKNLLLLVFVLLSSVTPYLFAVDTDADGIDDVVDADDDNDGILDTDEGVVHTNNVIDSGIDGAFSAANVSFDITSAAPRVPGTPHIINSITISGVSTLTDRLYDDLITPDAVVTNFSSVMGDKLVRRVDNGVFTADINIDPNYDALILPAFQDLNLQNFQVLGEHDFTNDSYTLFYDSPVISNAGGFVAFTERLGNNPLQAESFDENGASLGTIELSVTDYINTGHISNIDQDIFIAIYPIDDIAPVGSEIASIRITLVGDRVDAPDGKVLIYGDAGRISSAVDTDGDGVFDHIDPDSDNDGIADFIEGDVDTDNDGVIDSLDLDSDNDAIPDAVEAQAFIGYQSPAIGFDADNDGIVDTFDNTAGAFGGINAIPLDSDNDGLPDYKDNDSDNDGLQDLIESGLISNGIDTDGDGIADDTNASYADTDGVIDNPLTDLQNNTSANATGTDFRDTSQTDHDRDGIADIDDFDDDNDGVLDKFESPPVVGVISVGDSTETLSGVFTNGLSAATAFELVSGTPEVVISGQQNGVSEGLQLVWNQGSADQYNFDFVLQPPSQGVLESIHISGASPGAAGELLNSAKQITFTWPGGGLATLSDPMGEVGSHSNGATILSGASISLNVALPLAESQWSLDIDLSNATGPVTINFESDASAHVGAIDREGIALIPVIHKDSDGDGVADLFDIDSDNDGIPDLVESGNVFDVSIDTNGDGFVGISESVDSDSDGIIDAFEGDSIVSFQGTEPVDTDGDGLPDYVELDSDNDGITDAAESGGVDANGDGIVDGFSDANLNGLDDLLELAPIAITDFDSDGIFDYLDLDSDNDGIPDVLESGGKDSDGNGMVDEFRDSNADGVHDGSTGLPGSNTDGDNNADFIDLDSDNDGITDVSEAGGADANGDGMIDGFTDVNGDGLDDAAAANPFPITDSDNDGDPDHLDIDSNGNGIPDVVEAGGVDIDNDGEVDDFIDFDGDGLNDVLTSPEGDFDGDGLPNKTDPDSDNDGIPDSVELAGSFIDSDGDGFPDYLDTDSDNDTIPDALEGGSNGVDADNDGIDDTFDPDYTGGSDLNGDGIDDAVAADDFDKDGVPNYLDLDSDNDGLTDESEVSFTDADSDRDGHPNQIDLDSDNDGISDLLEAGGVDVDSDGVVDGLVDVNGDGLDDTLAIAPLMPPDADGDGKPDFLELDSDSDGFSDNLEAGVESESETLSADSDNDGIPDSVEVGADPAMPADTDRDGIPDSLDEDSDSDGIPDRVEAGDNPTNPTDTDTNGIPNFLELDSDKDGVPDLIEAGTTPTIPTDTDGDGIADFIDLDSDGDGITDDIEAGLRPTNPIDSNGDGIADFLDPAVIDQPTTQSVIESPEPNSSNNLPEELPVISPGVPTVSLTDSDNDGIPDSVEGLIDSDGDQIPNSLDLDSDNDGLLDSSEAGDNTASPLDTDGDSIADYIDLDSDNDGLTDLLETGRSDLDANGIVDTFIDTNSDGVDDAIAITDFVERDSDRDGFVDHLDIDSDNDGLPDSFESAGLGVDANGDGTVDDLTDTNGDGLADSVIVNSITDTDDDGVSNHLDTDSDNDGVADLVEAGGEDLNNDGIVDSWTDSDADGIVDSVDVDVSGGMDADGDGIDDFRDADFVTLQDSDSDGLVDLFDSDFLGTGFFPIMATRTAVDLSDLPDVDGNGVADVFDVGTGFGIVRTGLSGGGCSINPVGVSSSDPFLPLLALFATFGMVVRSKRTIPTVI